MKTRLWFIILTSVCCFCSQPVYAAGKYEKLLQQIHREIPELQTTSPLCIVLTSIQRCVGCGVLAVNGTMELVQQAHTTATCVVVLFAEREQEAEVVRNKFLSPFVIVDTTQTFLLPRFVRHYPMLLILDGKGNLLFHQADLQNAALAYTDVQKVLAAPMSAEENSGSIALRWEEHEALASGRISQKVPTDSIERQGQSVFLDEPKGYAIGNLMSPIIHDTTHTLIAINPLGNTIDAWNTTTGGLRFSLFLPDTVVYYFRADSTNKRWRDWEQQGATIAQLRSLAMAGDTLCVLVDVLSGYTEEKKYGRTPIGTMDTLVEIAWRKRQIVVRFYNQMLLDIAAVPETYSLIDLHIVPGGGFGGTCLWHKFRRSQPIEMQKDSLAFLCLYGSRDAVSTYQPAIQKLQSLLLPESGSVYSIGLATTASNGDIWYCDPNKEALFVLQGTGVLRRIPLRGALRSCMGGIVLADDEAAQDSPQKGTHSLWGIAATYSRLCVLLAPVDISSGVPHILQVYAVTGEFVGEYALDTLLINKTSVLQLVAYHNDEAVLLQRTPDKRWCVVRVPLQLSTPSLSAPATHRIAKP